MDGKRFDAWTRRRFSIATGGLVAFLLAELSREDAAAQKRRKKRCKKAGKGCGGRRKCCGQLRCTQAGEVNPRKRCCRNTSDAACRTSAECCLPLACNPTTGRCDVP